jgi:hypothetical protein
MRATKGEQILRYQDLYRNYSRLAFTQACDRPIAIASLQSRLLKAFKTEGGFGIFDQGPLPGHLRRSLLWHRAEEVPTLERIAFPVTREIPPSWSCMAYHNGITYLDPEFDGVDWEPLLSPWSRPGWPQPSPRLPGGGLTLGGSAHEFNASEAEADGKAHMFFDIPAQVHEPAPKCVILGMTYRRIRGQRRAYVLIIALGENASDQKVWRRIGAGYLPKTASPLKD